MKIAYFLDDNKALGGAGNLLLQQAALMSRIHDVIIVISADDNGYSEEYVQRCKQLQLKYILMAYHTGYNFYMVMINNYHKMIDNARKMEDLVRNENINFLHSVQLNCSVEYVARKLHIPHLMNIYQLREDEFRIYPGDIFSNHHLCDSELYSDRWSSCLNIESRCIRPVAILDHIKEKRIYQKAAINVLMLGDLCERKNQLTAIKALEQLPADSIELRIAGSTVGEYADACRMYVKKHELEQRVYFVGFVSDIVPLLDECDCLLCTSTDESFPSSMVEALTYDLTIISTPVAGVPEVFADEINSFVSKDFSEIAIRESIRKCQEYYERGWIGKIKENARQTWLKNFDRCFVREQINIYYEDICRGYSLKSIQPFYEIEEEINKIEAQLRNAGTKWEKWVYDRCFYFLFIKKKLNRGKAYIWGAGKHGKIAYEILALLCPDLEIEAFIDTFKEGWYCGKPVIRREEIEINADRFYLISFMCNAEEAEQYLMERGLEKNKQIWSMP